MHNAYNGVDFTRKMVVVVHNCCDGLPTTRQCTMLIMMWVLPLRPLRWWCYTIAVVGCLLEAMNGCSVSDWLYKFLS